MTSLDTVEMVTAFEEAFDVVLPIDDSVDLSRPDELVDQLALHLSNQHPNKAAAALLRKLAKDQDNPELAMGLEGTWRREQIAAIVREMLR